MPQGSILGPALFILYSQPLSDLISVHVCNHHKYANDPELSKGAPPDKFSSVQSCIDTCINDVFWMNSNKLKLNTNKTEVMPVGLTSCLGLVDIECTNIDGNSVLFKTFVKYLRVHLNRISPKVLPQDLSQQWSFPALIIVTQSSQVYQWTRSIGDSEYRIMQDNLLCKKWKQDLATPLLQELYWLFMKFRCQYKIATLAHFHFDRP